MTNEEKIKEIIGCKASNCYNCEYTMVSTDKKFHRKGCRDMFHLREMAKWKEKQLIEKACEWLDLNLQGGVHPQSSTRLIGEFKKAMEE